MTKHSKIRKALSAILKTGQILGVLGHDSMAKDVENLFNEFSRIHGKRFAVQMLKALYQESIRFSCGLKVEPVTPMWLQRSKKDNFPKIMQPFRKALRGPALERRMVLSLLRTFESIKLSPVPDLGSVIDPSSGEQGFEGFRFRFERFLNKSRFSRRIKKTFNSVTEQMVKSSTSIGLHYSTKKGVFGPTCATAGKQALQINEEILESMVTLLGIFNKKAKDLFSIIKDNQEFFRDKKDLFDTTKKVVPPDLGRIAFIPDKGGKTRLVAIGNYWIQVVLLEMHKSLYRVLKTIGQDGTYAQNERSEEVRKASSVGPVWSYDLTAATDRFPICIQLCVLDYLNSTMSSSWKKFLNYMTFYYKGSSYRYAVGQPMGLYSSWATFTLTHHFLVQYCAFEEGYYTFDKYSILGDDVAIWDKKVAHRYEQCLHLLDVNISRQKSFIPESDSGPCVAEFAKRIYDKGVEVSALSPNQCLAMEERTLYVIPEFINWLKNHSFPIEGTPASRLFEVLNLSVKKREKLSCLLRITEILTAPVLTEVSEGLPETWKKIDAIFIAKVRLANLAEQALDLSLECELIDWDNRESLEDALAGPIPDNLYFLLIIQKRLNDLLELKMRMSEQFPSEFFMTYSLNDMPVRTDTIAQLSEIEYLPHIDFKSLSKGLTSHDDKKQMRGKFIELLEKKARKYFVK